MNTENRANNPSAFGSRLDWEQREKNLENIRLERENKILADKIKNAQIEQAKLALKKAEVSEVTQKMVDEIKRGPGRPRKEDTVDA